MTLLTKLANKITSFSKTIFQFGSEPRQTNITRLIKNDIELLARPNLMTNFQKLPTTNFLTQQYQGIPVPKLHLTVKPKIFGGITFQMNSSFSTKKKTIRTDKRLKKIATKLQQLSNEHKLDEMMDLLKKRKLILSELQFVKKQLENLPKDIEFYNTKKRFSLADILLNFMIQQRQTKKRKASIKQRLDGQQNGMPSFMTPMTKQDIKKVARRYVGSIGSRTRRLSKAHSRGAQSRHGGIQKKIIEYRLNGRIIKIDLQKPILHDTAKWMRKALKKRMTIRGRFFLHF